MTDRRREIFDLCGPLDGTTPRFFMARFLGDDDEDAETFMRPYKYMSDSPRGEMGVFRRAGLDNGALRCRWYHKSDLFEIGKEIPKEKVIEMLRKEGLLHLSTQERVREFILRADAEILENSEKLWSTEL